MALTVKLLLLGKTLKAAPEIPLGTASPLVTEEAKLLFSWLAIGEAVVAMFEILCFLLRKDSSKVSGVNNMLCNKRRSWC